MEAAVASEILMVRMIAKVEGLQTYACVGMALVLSRCFSQNLCDIANANVFIYDTANPKQLHKQSSFFNIRKRILCAGM